MALEQVNKPLRVVHSPNSPILELPAPSSSTSLGSSDSDSALLGSPELDFKAKMAQLEDKNSPNVYVEGYASRLFRCDVLTILPGFP